MVHAKILVHQQVAKIPKTENSHMSATNSWTKPTLTALTNTPGTIIANTILSGRLNYLRVMETNLIYLSSYISFTQL